MSSGSTGGRGGDAKTILSPNTLFGDIIHQMVIAYLLLNAVFSRYTCG